MGANLKEVRERIQSVNSTEQITKAMKMVSAAKLRRAQDAISQLRPYADKLNDILSNVVTNLGDDANVSYGVERPIENVCIVLVTSNRGLCGAFNTNLQKEAVKHIEQTYSAQLAAGKLSVLPIGKKGHDFFKKRFPQATIINDYVNLFSDLSFKSTSLVPNRLLEAFDRQTFDAIDIIYGYFRNAAVQYPIVEQFLPIPKLTPKENETDQATTSHNADYIFEPEKEALLEELVPTILLTKFHKCLLDTHASEHGARMTAMDNATNNAQELKRDLKIAYNKARQEAITKEISEIVGGAAALNG